MINGLKMGQ